ncbi:MAG: ATP-binding protein [Richelia sp. RM2_1_2]|nr:ATP-binding protein [Richelia sp. RM1_1_1]NJO59713.1 ATP-binding protein [Richelia sp. RM2_1_2]
MSDEVLIPEFDVNGNGSHAGTPNANEADSTEDTNASHSTLGVRIIGKVASPPQKESTSEKFHFWVRRDELVEKTQIVRTESHVGGETINFYAIVEEVYRQSRKKDIGEEFDAFDGNVDYQPEFRVEGVTFATATILRTERPVLAPPLEQSSVFLGDENDARRAYRADEIDNPLAIGLIKNGGSAIAGPGMIDLDYLLGINGGHMNVNGVAGRGTKSSFLLFVIYQLLRLARHRAEEYPSDPNPLIVVPIILNVKGYDLFHINRWSSRYRPEEHLADWQRLGVEEPRPFENVTFFAPQMPNGDIAVATGCRSEVQPYSWSLGDIIEKGLFTYLFADDDSINDNFRALVLDLEAFLTHERVENDGIVTRSLQNNAPQTFQELLDWVRESSNQLPGDHHKATWSKLRRKLLLVVHEGNGALRRYDQNGHPLDLGQRQTIDPIVVDLNALTRVPSLQRFVVATILQQLVNERTGTNRVEGLVYLIALDELNRFAPRGSKDPITQLIETVAAEMRSQGIILLGAQQQASKVSEKVIENASIRVIGRSGSLELSQSIWRFLSKSNQRKAAELTVSEKMVIQDNEPMHVRVPLPPWAMNPREATGNPVIDVDATTVEEDNDDDIATY